MSVKGLFRVNRPCSVAMEREAGWICLDLWIVLVVLVAGFEMIVQKVCQFIWFVICFNIVRYISIYLTICFILSRTMVDHLVLTMACNYDRLYISRTMVDHVHFCCN